MSLTFTNIKTFESWIKMFTEEISEDDPSNVRVYQAIEDLATGEKLGDGTNYSFIYGDENLPDLYTFVDTTATAGQSTINIDEADTVDLQNPPGNFWKYSNQGIYVRE